MKVTDAIDEIVRSYSQNSFMRFQGIIRNNVLSLQEIKMVQNTLTMLLKEKEKENCEFMVVSLQVFVQKYHEQLLDWLYVLLVQLIIRQSLAKMDSHTRTLKDTADLLRNLFPQKVLLQLCCKLVIDNVQTTDSGVKINLLKFIRLLIVSTKPEIIGNSFSDLVMAISRIISWTVDIKSLKVRKESEMVIHKFYTLNPAQFVIIVKSLPSGFQERTKIILKDNLTFGSFFESESRNTESTETVIHETKTLNDNSITLAMNEPVYPRPGLFDMPNSKFQQRYMSNTNHDNKLEQNIISRNSATVTYNDAHEIINDFKNVNKNCPSNQVSQLNDDTQINSNEMRKSRNSLSSKYFNEDDDFDKTNYTDNSREINIQHSKKSHKKKKKSSVENLQNEIEDPNVMMKNIIQELSRYNERHQERKLSLISLIKCIHSQNKICWDMYFKTVMSILLETLGDNEGGTRKLAVLSIQELAKVEPQRFQDQILLIINKLLHCFMDIDQGVIEAIKSCVIIFSQYLNVDTLWRTLNVIIVENETEIQCSGLKFMQYVINASSPVIVSSLLIETLSLLNKLTVHKNMKNRKNSVYCLLAIYKKIGDKIWPHLKNFDKNKIRLLQIYIHRLK